LFFFVYCQNRLRGSGHGIAAARMDAKLNAAGWMSEKMGGLRLENLYTPVTYCEGACIYNPVIISIIVILNATSNIHFVYWI